MERVPVAGATLWTETSCSGIPVVLVHGGPGLWDYLGPLADLLGEGLQCHRFDQRGCGRSTGAAGPFTIAQAVADLDDLRAHWGHRAWWLLGHSWGAELAVRYAAAHPDRTLGVVYVGGVGAGDGFRAAHNVEFARRLGPDRERFDRLSARTRSAAEEHELCVLRWRTDVSPTADTTLHAEALWATRPPGAEVSQQAASQLWADRATEDLLVAARRVEAPVTMIQGRDDPRPFHATDDLLAALPSATRHVLDGTGHAPWAERPVETTRLIRVALGLPTKPPGGSVPLAGVEAGLQLRAADLAADRLG